MTIVFTAHNIRLDDGSYTKPDAPYPMHEDPLWLAAARVLETVFPGDKQAVRVADLGCLEGGYAVEFARLGCKVLGLEVREANIAACHYVQRHTRLPNLSFVQDDAWNLKTHGPFDAVFCCGLFYHLDRPRAFLDLLASVTGRLLILQTHFTTAEPAADWAGELSELVEHEGLAGRWFREFGEDMPESQREQMRWSSWRNHRSFWVQREYLLGAIHQAGFDLGFEQFDGLGPDIATQLLEGAYQRQGRGTFVGIKQP